MPQPQNHHIFDPWNSASTGHQRAESSSSNTTAWRHTRAAKLAAQFSSASGDCLGDGDVGGDGDVPPSSQAVAVAKEPSTTNSNITTNTTMINEIKTKQQQRQQQRYQGEWKWVSTTEMQRRNLGCRDIRGMLGGQKKRGIEAVDGHGYGYKQPEGTGSGTGRVVKRQLVSYTSPESTPTPKSELESTPEVEVEVKSTTITQSTIFTGTTIYINGSTMPYISDHRLRALLVAHGATLAMGMARRSVSHVIVGEANAGPAKVNVNVKGEGSGNWNGKGAGGGLAAGKLEREVGRAGWKGVRVVTVGWVLESVKAGKRLSETRFGVKMAAGGQGSVFGMFGGGSGRSSS